MDDSHSGLVRQLGKLVEETPASSNLASSSLEGQPGRRTGTASKADWG